MWSEPIQSQTEVIDQYLNLMPLKDEPILAENDFFKIINLEERYNYFKTLIKLQRLNNLNEDNNQKNMIKVMMQLIEYYAQCISEAEINLNNIVLYFQQKMKDLNYHYRAIVDRQKSAKERQNNEALSPRKIQLGNIQESDSVISLDKNILEKMDDNSSCSDVKSNYTKSLMFALQNQNINEHIDQTLKKADFLKKTINNSIKNQQQALFNRIRDKRKKTFLQLSKEAPQSTTVGTPTSHNRMKRPLKRNKQFYSSFHTTYQSKMSSDSELDDAESIYIQNFNLQFQEDFNKGTKSKA